MTTATGSKAIIRLNQNNPDYPLQLQDHADNDIPVTLEALGNLEILKHNLLALFCSVKCPGSLILQTHDLAQHLWQAGVPVISGFHSPLEKECLTVLLRGRQPIIACPARSLVSMRLRTEWEQPLQQNRLLILSPFIEGQRRATANTAQVRNRFVAVLAAYIFIAYAAPGGKSEQFCREVVGWGKPVYTFNHDANSNLLKMGAKGVEIEELVGAVKNHLE